MTERRLRVIETGEEVALTLGSILDKPGEVGGKAGAVQAAVIREKLNAVMTQEKLRSETPIVTLKGDAREKIKAQEYIPDRTREDDHTDTSNIAVEALLRQGREYRAHCWLGSQRVAHLNVSASNRFTAISSTSFLPSTTA